MNKEYKLPSLKVSDIRNAFAQKLLNSEFTSVNREKSMTSLTGSSTIELIGTSFIVDEDSIFGEVNWDYVKREEDWYTSLSLNVNDIPGGAPAVWKAVADKEGFINSNYGWCVFSPENLPNGNGTNQYEKVVEELTKNKESRRAQIIYTRPEMWIDYNKNGRSDFMCTNTVQYMIRDGALHSIVEMRSNDAILGFRNDYQWQRLIQEKLAKDLNVDIGNVYWQTGSLHVYERHYYLVDNFIKTGKKSIIKEAYIIQNPTSKFI